MKSPHPNLPHPGKEQLLPVQAPVNNKKYCHAETGKY